MRGNDFSKDGKDKSDGITGDIHVPVGQEGILAHDLMRGLEGAVPAYGGRDVLVGFYGSGAFCSFEHSYVNLPALPQSLVIPRTIAREIRGFAMHEAAHLLYTDNDFMMNGRSDAEKKDSFLHHVWNCFEDFMIEKFFLEVYPGAHKNFSATEHRCCTEYLYKAYRENPDIAKDLRSVGPVALTWARSIYFGLDTSLSRECMKTLPTELQRRVWEWFYEAEPLETTEENFVLARKVAQEIRDNPIDPNDPPANPNGLPGMPGAQQGNGSPGNGQGSGGPGNMGVWQPGSKSGNPDHNKDPQGNPEPTPVFAGKNLDAALKDLGADDDLKDAQGEKQLVFLKQSNSEQGTASEAISDPEGTALYQLAMKETKNQIHMISRRLKRALETLTRSREKGGRRDGRLDTRRLTNAMFCDNAIYRRKLDKPNLDTAVTILVDTSTSMKTPQRKMCQQIAVACNEAFTGTPVAVEILGYTAGGPHQLDDNENRKIEAIQATGEDVDASTVELYEFKPFEGNKLKTMTSIGNSLHVGRGGTPTTEAIYVAANRLSRRFKKEKRHVLFVLTDGEPNDVESCKEAVRRVEKQGVTVVGFGIMTPAVEASFNDWVHVSDLNDLAATVMTRLSDILFRDVRKRGFGKIELPHTVTDSSKSAA